MAGSKLPNAIDCTAIQHPITANACPDALWGRWHRQLSSGAGSGSTISTPGFVLGFNVSQSKSDKAAVARRTMLAYPRLTAELWAWPRRSRARSRSPGPPRAESMRPH